MGQTLTNGIYLPDEGERNSYSGLEVNWRTLDALILTVNGKAAPNIANTWTAAQTFTAGITGDLTGNVTGNVTGDLTGTAAKAIADEDGTSIKTGYVNVAGNQTVSGQKTWTGSNTFSAGVLTTTVETSPGNTVLVIRSTDQTWESGARIFLYSNTQTGQTNGSIYVDVDHGDNGNTKTGLTLVPNAFHPMGGTVNTTYGVSLGTATYQWAKVYSEQYYYNGTAWGLDKSNVWGNTQTVTGNDKGWNIINPDIEKGVIPSANKSCFVWWADKNNNFLGRICSRVHTDGTTMLWLSSLNYYKNGALDPTGSSATTSLILGVDANAYKFVQTNADFRPDVNNAFNLGTSTNKWKTLNGINPGALSLPDASNAVALDTTNVSMDGTYTYLSVSVNGWLYVALKDTTCKTDGELTFYIGDSGTSSAYAKWAVNFVCSTDGYVRCFIPVLANSRIRVRVNPNGGSPTGLTMTIYPCLGNV